MISKKTVLVLGSGASNAYGYPLQEGLKKAIIKQLNDHHVLNDLGQVYGFSEFIINNFRESFQNSGLLYIEEFLRNKPEFKEIGTILLVKTINSFENNELLFKDEYWYSYLYNHLYNSSNNLNKVSFITFNFDRSLEAFLFQAFNNSHTKPESYTIEQFNQIPIVHIYGQSGGLPWQHLKSTCSYGELVNVNKLQELAKDIIIDSLDESINQNLIKAKELLVESEVIVFLGFGYNENNIQKLEIDKLQGKNIFGSTYSLMPGEIKAIKQLFNGKISFAKTKTAQHLKIKEFLQETGILEI